MDRLQFPDNGENLVSYRDRFGSVMTMASSGQGYVLFEMVNPDPNQPNLSLELPVADLIPLFTDAVRATGMSPGELKLRAKELGLVKPAGSGAQPPQLSRQERRNLQRRLGKSKRPAPGPGATLGTPPLGTLAAAVQPPATSPPTSAFGTLKGKP